MPIEKHDLVHELPEYRDQIHHLKMNNAHFAKLFDAYHDVEHEVHRIEEGVETPSDEYLANRKKSRLKLKDELFDMLKKHTEATA
ncbi:YdcH family protein [Aestuariirhabdus sp. Z084]|uniref:YdcH family protein n=1 Tax=Aestuariirhabdus haliotis TaxID=2918751 RepID=UPI00201B3760|nr:YdcH family protein [Aestuariirhabdus haliotis]MCL6417661.1 YdcH family protein [Aestuariirhabdus haliotis]MCL6421577.1 YdcH family protein [Aestuariirhabdus haliotis]